MKSSITFQNGTSVSDLGDSLSKREPMVFKEWRGRQVSVQITALRLIDAQLGFYPEFYEFEGYLVSSKERVKGDAYELKGSSIHAANMKIVDSEANPVCEDNDSN